MHAEAPLPEVGKKMLQGLAHSQEGDFVPGNLGLRQQAHLQCFGPGGKVLVQPSSTYSGSSICWLRRSMMRSLRRYTRRAAKT